MRLTSLLLPALLLTCSAGAVPALTNLKLVSPQVAWGVSESGVYRSSDGGGTWQNLTPALGGEVQSAFFLDADHAWLTTPSVWDVSGKPVRPAYLLRTADAGKHWQRFTLFLGGGGSIHFTDAQHGSALVDLEAGMSQMAFVLLKTGNGGATWTKVNSAQRGYMDLPELAGGTLPDTDGPNGFALLPRFGVLTGQYGPLDQPYLWLTRDGGRHFRDGAAALPYTALEKKTTARTTLAWASGDWARLVSVSLPAQGSSTLRTFWTQNGAQTWHGSEALRLPPNSHVAATFSDWQNGWLSVLSADNQSRPLPLHLLRTTDGGKNWRDLGIAWTDDDPPAYTFFGDKVGLALRHRRGEARALWRTRDGGQTWRELP